MDSEEKDEDRGHERTPANPGHSDQGPDTEARENIKEVDGMKWAQDLTSDP
jgi:hypothetical protein